jgi:anion-transporting  ArsA/GET3 family ATPase
VTAAVVPGPGSPLAGLARSARIVVCCGSGGVGKTSTAAAVALWAAQSGRRTCVLTIDPARRLAQALGLDLLSNAPRPVRAKGLPARGPGSLDAMMLDMRRTFDEVIERYARDPEQADRILANRFYQRLSSTLAGTQEYMAMEKLYELHESQRYDLLVVDTPPTRSALDFLDAPDNLNELLDARAFRLLIAPAQRIGRGYLRGLNLATTAMTKMVRRVTGSELLAEVGEFFAAFEGMYDGFKERAGLVYDQLKHPSTAFVVVATPDGPALREAAYFAGRLAADRMPLGALVVNRIHQAGPVPQVPAGPAWLPLQARDTGETTKPIVPSSASVSACSATSASFTSESVLRTASWASWMASCASANSPSRACAIALVARACASISHRRYL